MGYDGASVVFLVNQVDADTGDAFAGGDYGGMDSLAVHSASTEFGQQRGVDVQDAVAVSAESPGAEFLHVAGERYELDAARGQGVSDGGVEVGGVGVGDGAEVAVGMLARRARSRAKERELLEMTTRISAWSEPAAQASMIAWRLVPPWEARTPMGSFLFNV